LRGNAGQGVAAWATPTIRYPAPDTIIALGPDISAERERVVFSASPAVPGLQWRIENDVIIAQHGRAYWKPVPGHHLVVLEDA
jgi:Penicillin-Binding Protein C-terminus Family